MRFQSCLSTEPAGSSLTQAPRLHQFGPGRFAKRAMDLAGGIMLLALGWPWMLLAALRIKRRTGGPVFRGVELLGQHCRPFQAYLFRDRGAELSWAVKRLPMVISLLKGEMSLVGPEPLQATGDASGLQWNELRQFARKPGLTGTWLLEAHGKASPKKAGKAAAKPGAQGSLAKDLAILLRSAALALRSSRRTEKGENKHARSGRQRQ